MSLDISVRVGVAGDFLAAVATTLRNDIDCGDKARSRGFAAYEALPPASLTDAPYPSMGPAEPASFPVPGGSGARSRGGAAGGGSGGSGGSGAPVPEGGPAGERGIHPELAARLRAAEAARPPGTPPLEIISGHRSHAQQADIWRRSRGGRLFKAAPPGRSRHERFPAQAADIRDPSGYYHRAAGRFGYHFPVRGDYPHAQMNPSWRGRAKPPKETKE